LAGYARDREPMKMRPKNGKTSPKTSDIGWLLARRGADGQAQEQVVAIELRRLLRQIAGEKAI
jgi:hypothetical protein